MLVPRGTATNFKPVWKTHSFLSHFVKMVKLSVSILFSSWALSHYSTLVNGFGVHSLSASRNDVVSMASMASSGVPPTSSEASETVDTEIPTNLPSDCGMDYIPLATMLATGQLAEADQVSPSMLIYFSCFQYALWFRFHCQFTRDALIAISGAKDKKRDFVYFTDVKNIPSTDLATIERLWNQFSGGKFGYSVQKVRVFISSIVL